MTTTEEQILNFLLEWVNDTDFCDGDGWFIRSESPVHGTTFGDLVDKLHAERNPATNSWIFEVHGCGDPKDKFTTNALRFDTEEAAKGYGFNLGMRWFGFDDSRVSPSQDEATHSWNEETQSTVDLRTNTEYHAPEKVKL